MTDTEPTTVAVPVELLRAIHDHLDDEPYRIKIESLLPKPKLRLVAVEYDRLGRDGLEYADAQPDLLTLLDEQIDSLGFSSHSDIPKVLKSRIRTALGVTE